jgi:DNA-binding CsgD family transcriptional regulator
MLAIKRMLVRDLPAALTLYRSEASRRLMAGPNEEVAAVLFISLHMAVNLVAGIMNKLGVDSRTAAATWAVRNGLV